MDQNAPNLVLPAKATTLQRETSYVYTAPSHRLLFRGSFSVPNSRLTLDGLTFTVPIKSSPVKLMDNPLALALESMRGRTLALSGVTHLDAVYLDRSTTVNLDIHPTAYLTRLYFENQLCSQPFTSEDGATDIGVRVIIGTGDENPLEMVIFGQAISDLAHTEPLTPKITLLVARILPTAPPATRLPRPDDPSPRVPPLVSFGKKRPAPSDPINDTPTHKRQKHVRSFSRAKSNTSHLNKDPTIMVAREILIKGKEGPTPISEQLTKQSTSTSRSVSVADDDIFKVPDIPARSQGPDDIPDIAKELEKANKATMKRIAMDSLAKLGLTKDSQDYKEIFNHVYQGAQFAMRSQLRSRAVDTRTAEKYTQVHADMYVRATASSRGK